MTSILKNQPTDFDAEQYNKYIKYYLDNEFSGIVSSRDRLNGIGRRRDFV